MKDKIYRHEELIVGMKVKVNMMGVLRRMDNLDVEDERYHGFVESEIIEINEEERSLKVEYEIYEFEPTELPLDAVQEVIESDGTRVPVHI